MVKEKFVENNSSFPTILTLNKLKTIIEKLSLSQTELSNTIRFTF